MLGQNLSGSGSAGEKQKIIETAEALLSGKDYVNAYLLLERLEQEQSVPVLYNLALCCYAMKRYTRTAALLERAWTEAGKLGAPRKTMCRQPDTINKEVALKGTEHLSFMPQSMPELLGMEARERIVRLIIDAYSYAGNAEKVSSYTNLLTQKNYAHVIEAAERVKRGGL